MPCYLLEAVTPVNLELAVAEGRVTNHRPPATPEQLDGWKAGAVGLEIQSVAQCLRRGATSMQTKSELEMARGRSSRHGEMRAKQPCLLSEQMLDDHLIQGGVVAISNQCLSLFFVESSSFFEKREEGSAAILEMG